MPSNRHNTSLHWFQLVLICVLFVTAGCASQNRSQDDTFRQYTNSGNYADGLAYSLERADAENRQSADQQWLLQAASLSFILNDPGSSNDLFTKAESLSRDQDLQGRLATTSNLARQIAVDQGATKYESTYYEETMMNFYQAINYWSSGDAVNARIEFMRLDERQRRSAEYYAERIIEQREALEEDEQASGVRAAERQLAASLRQWEPYEGYVNPAATYLDGIFFLTNAVDASDTRRALSSLERAYGLTGNEAIQDDIEIAEARASGLSPDLSDTVWVIFEQGRIAQKENRRIDIPMFTGTGVVYTGVAFPEMTPDSSEQPALTITDDEGTQYTTTGIGDMDRIAVADYKVELPSLVAKSMASSAVTAVGQEAARQQFGIGGALTGALYQEMTNNADTRTWSLLPKDFQVVRLDHSGDTLSLSTEHTLSPTTVEIEPTDHPTVVYVKQTGLHAPLAVQQF